MPNVNFASGQTIDISQFSVVNMPMGFQLTDINGQTWTLTPSMAPVDATHLSVKNDPTLRWVLGSSNGGGFVPEADYWVSPGGLNTNPGTQSAPMETMAAAYIKGYPNGVRIHADIGAQWSNGTETMGTTGAISIANKIWLRSDGWHTVIPGWLPMQQFEICGWSLGSDTQIGTPYAALTLFTSDSNDLDRLDAPPLWIASGTTQFRFKEVGWRHRMPARIGWDYRRNNDSSKALTTITNANRAATGLTTLTFGAMPGWVVSQLSRTANITTARVLVTAGSAFANLPGPLESKWFTVNAGSGSTSFPTTTFIPGATIVPNAVGGYFDVSYPDAGPNVALTPVTGGTATGHMLQVGDIVDWVSTNSQFPTTMYQVQAVTDATHVVLWDTNGYSPRNASTGDIANPGQLVLQCRQFGIAFDRWENCCIRGTFDFGPGGNTRWNYGPTIDHAGNNSFGTYVSGGEYDGACWDDGTSFHNGVRDHNRAAAWLVWSGFGGACALQMYDTKTLAGQIRFQGGRSDIAGIRASNVLQDGTIGLATYACIDIPSVAEGGGPVSILNLDNCGNADAGGSFGDVDLGFNPGFVTGCNVVLRGNNAVLTNCFYRAGNGITDSFESQGFLGWEPGGYLSGKRDDAVSQFGVYQALGITNQISENVSTWSTNAFGNAVTVTSGQASPDGSSSAFKLVSPSSGGAKFTSVNLGGGIAAGDYIVASAWIKAPSGGVNAAVGSFMWLSMFSSATESLTDVVASTAGIRAGNGEWQFVNLIGQIGATAVSNAYTWANFQIYTPQGSVPIYVDGAFIAYFPAASFAKNDAFRYWRTLRHLPSYALPSGAAGTRAGQKLVGHGGLGTGTAFVAGVGSGQLTVVGSFTPKKYEPMYNADGTIKGWFELVNATINP